MFCAGYPAIRNIEVGSWFVRYFVYVCSSEAHFNDLARMMTKVGLRLFNFFFFVVLRSSQSLARLCAALFADSGRRNKKSELMLMRRSPRHSSWWGRRSLPPTKERWSPFSALPASDLVQFRIVF